MEEDTYTADYAGYRADDKFVEFATQFTRDHLIPRIPPPARLLDVGCGAGSFMEIAQSAGYAVEGIDVSEASAEICRRKGLSARAGDFLTEEFNGTFDLITMWDVVEHLQDPGTFLRRARSLLSDRGIFFAKIPAFGALSVRVSARYPAAAGALLGAPGHVQYFDQNSLSILMDRAGFDTQWISAGAARSPNRGGSIKRRVGRHVRDIVKRVSQDGNLYVLGTSAA